MMVRQQPAQARLRAVVARGFSRQGEACTVLSASLAAAERIPPPTVLTKANGRARLDGVIIANARPIFRPSEGL
jgi:hypothetical protein